MFFGSRNQFKNRVEAGRSLAQKLAPLVKKNSIVFGLPRGGVPVAHEVALAHSLPLEVVVARKIGAPQSPEYGIGAIAETGVEIIHWRDVRKLGLSKGDVKEVLEEERKELERRVDFYREGKSLKSLKGKQAILIDDGLATGVTALAAVQVLMKLGAKEIILGLPVCGSNNLGDVRDSVNHLICLEKPDDMRSISMHYQEFGQVSDDEVKSILKKTKSL